jgi:hypothetical protein
MYSVRWIFNNYTFQIYDYTYVDVLSYLYTELCKEIEIVGEREHLGGGGGGKTAKF